MAATRQIDLLLGEEPRAKILIDPDGRKLLLHDLVESQIACALKLQPYEGGAKLLCQAAVREGPCVLLRDESGQVRLVLAEDDDGELFEVVDPKGEARLKLALVGPGATGNEPIKDGWLALELCRVTSNPGIMMGKRVVRGTRITVELILRRLAGGATEEDLLRDYPQLTRDDIHEALLAAAKAERARSAVASTEKASKP